MNMLLCGIDGLLLWVTAIIHIYVCSSIIAFRTKLQGRLARSVMAWVIRSIQEFNGEAEFSTRNLPLWKFCRFAGCGRRNVVWQILVSADSLPQIPLCNLQDAGCGIAMSQFPHSQSLHPNLRVVDLHGMILHHRSIFDVGCGMQVTGSDIASFVTFWPRNLGFPHHWFGSNLRDHLWSLISFAFLSVI